MASTLSTAAEEWPSAWLRGVLQVCVMSVLADGPTYGYAISQALEEGGLGAVKGGTLYPLLGRLEDAGLVDVQWRPGESGPGRKYYRLNEAGHAELAAKGAQWQAFADLTTSIINAAAGSERGAP